jgi:hypothetical protein
LPPADAPEPIVKQALTPRQKFRAFLATADSSPYEGEQDVSLRKANKLVREQKWRWYDLLDADARAEDATNQAEIATEAAAVLLAENNQLRSENNSLRAEIARLGGGNSTSTTLAPGDWKDVGDPQRQARWYLDQHAARKLHLNAFEIDFLGTIADCVGDLSAGQQSVFTAIMKAVTRRSGRKPPS